MGFLKRESAPSELPDLALDSSKESGKVVSSVSQAQIKPKSISEIAESIPEPVVKKPEIEETKEESEEESFEFSKEDHKKINAEEIRNKIYEHLKEENNEVDVIHPKFFDSVLEDINVEIEDLGKLEDWYENKFSSQDIVSNMKGYWEGNKADIIIQSFGAKYKKKINENVKELQRLEEDWRSIYFGLIKKEEEMKIIEQELKSTLAEFVDVCKRRKNGDEEKKE